MRAGQAAITALSVAVMVGPGRAGLTTWNDVVESYGRVRDYTALYEKQERAIASGERQRIRLSFRKPLDVRLDWLDADGRVDQTAIYRQGFNGGKVVARKAGLLGRLAGTVMLDPHDRLAMQDSRHPITDVGIGHIIDLVSEEMHGGLVTAAPPRDVVLDGRNLDEFAIASPSSAGILGVEGARRAIVWVDRDLKLPVKVDVLAADASVIERHSFKDLRVNVGLTDETFSL